ncbi:MAG: (2Fe-2S)-binding protein, partial [Chloroflexota bacterium]
MSTATNQPRTQPALVRAASLDELQQRGCIVVSGGRHGIAVFWHEGKVYAVDNRCPHMGFPLSRGSLKEGILPCHWHHARFDLESGGTFDPFADDVTVYRTEVRDGEVWVDLRADGRNHTARWLGRLQDGLEQNLSLVTAKSILALEDLGTPAAELLRIGGLYGTRYRQAGWGPGLTIMTAMANVLPDLAG